MNKEKREDMETELQSDLELVRTIKEIIGRGNSAEVKPAKDSPYAVYEVRKKKLISDGGRRR